jgi:hypothetical protein
VDAGADKGIPDTARGKDLLDGGADRDLVGAGADKVLVDAFVEKDLPNTGADKGLVNAGADKDLRVRILLCLSSQDRSHEFFTELTHVQHSVCCDFCNNTQTRSEHPSDSSSAK